MVRVVNRSPPNQWDPVFTGCVFICFLSVVLVLVSEQVFHPLTLITTTCIYPDPSDTFLLFDPKVFVILVSIQIILSLLGFSFCQPDNFI